MNSPFLRAQHYHEQAANLRGLAVTEQDLEQSRALSEIAENYDKLAKKMLDLGRIATSTDR